MASINGIQIKNLKKFKGHDCETLYQGSVYYNGKKLGSWSQDAWGGCDNYDFDPSVLDDEVKKFAKSDYVEDKYRDITRLDSLMFKLVELSENEKEYNKATRQGYNSYIVATDGYHVLSYCSTRTDKNDIVKNDFHKKFLAHCEQVRLKNEKLVVSIYSTPNDFVITLK